MKPSETQSSRGDVRKVKCLIWMMTGQTEAFIQRKGLPGREEGVQAVSRAGRGAVGVTAGGIWLSGEAAHEAVDILMGRCVSGEGGRDSVRLMR